MLNGDLKQEIVGVLKGIGTAVIILIILAIGLAGLDCLTKLQ